MLLLEKKSRLVPLNAIPTRRSTTLANAEMQTPSSITVDNIRPVSIKLVTVLNLFVFFANRSQNSISSSRFVLISLNFFKKYVCESRDAVRFRFG